MKIREYIETKVGTASFSRTIELNDVESIFDIIEDYSKQEQEQAVSEALRMASEESKAEYGDNSNQYNPQVNKQSILSLAPKVLEKLK